MADEEAPWLIMDYGSGSIQSGTSDNDAPQYTSKTCIGDDEYIDEKLEEKANSVSKLTWPMARGVVQDWPSMEKIWELILGSDMLNISHPNMDVAGIFLTEPCLNSTKNREKVAEYWFDKQNISRLYVGLQAVCALFGEGRSTGVVINSGDGVTEAVPVYENYGMRHAYRRIPWAGRNITQWFRTQLENAGTSLGSGPDELILWDMKEKLCYCAGFGKYEEEAAAKKSLATDYTLPDNTTITVHDEVVSVAETLFNPRIAGQSYPGIQELTLEALNNCPLDCREDLYKNMICIGGNSSFTMFPERISAEMRNAVGEVAEDAKVKVFCPPDRVIKPWVGAQIMTCLDHFISGSENNQTMWASKQHFNEAGPSCVLRMSPS